MSQEEVLTKGDRNRLRVVLFSKSARGRKRNCFVEFLALSLIFHFVFAAHALCMRFGAHSPSRLGASLVTNTY